MATNESFLLNNESFLVNRAYYLNNYLNTLDGFNRKWFVDNNVSFRKEAYQSYSRNTD